VLAAYGEVLRELSTEVPAALYKLSAFKNPKIVMPGVVALETNAFSNYETAGKEIESLSNELSVINYQLSNYPLIIVCDSAHFVSESLNNFLWVTFTRCNPSHDLYGIDSFTENKHWGCNGPLVFDARIKPHHAPPVEKDAAVEKHIDRLFEKGGSLYQILKK
jgi:4-hydroxy-3-polyprenylbenzoate decarboxylase